MAALDSSATGEGPAPDETLQMFRMGLQLHKQGELVAAEAIYEEVLRRDSDNAEARHLLGVLALQGGRPEQAVDLISQAIELSGAAAGMYANRARAFAVLGRQGDALADYDRAAALQPQTRGLALPRGQALAALGDWPASVAACRLATLEAPASAEAWGALGGGLDKLGLPAAALESLDRALALDGANPVSHFNRGNVLRELRRIGEAVDSYSRAIEIDPDFAVAHHNRAICRLLEGDWAQGFADYEWRRRSPDFDDPRYALPNALAPGDDLAGKTLYIWPELFLGDTLQFARYALMAEAAGASVVLAAPRPLHAILRTISPSLTLIGPQDQPERYDLQCALMSLPAAFATRPDNVPAPSPYLAAEPARVARLRKRIGGQKGRGGGLRIGVCWQGSTGAYAASMRRSFPLAALRPLAEIPGVRLISLQKHDGLDQLAALPAGMNVETLGEDFDAGPDAFVDTAAAITACDLVITADTAVAHVAGALGAETWLALPYVPDWRWGLAGERTAWYPTLRLFRQPAAGHWAAVVAAMAAALAARQGNAHDA